MYVFLLHSHPIEALQLRVELFIPLVGAILIGGQTLPMHQKP
jgi:hypothetical protein